MSSLNEGVYKTFQIERITKKARLGNLSEKKEKRQGLETYRKRKKKGKAWKLATCAYQQELGLVWLLVPVHSDPKL